MLSGSNLTISWKQPDLAEEEWEFFKHPGKQPFYREHGIGWQDIRHAFERGTLAPYPRGEHIGGIPVALSWHRYEDYARYLAKARRGYRLSYSKMENELQQLGTLALPAPIVLKSGGKALLFSGYRRLCLAWNYGMVPFVWLATME
jgi:hypothetical protein